MRDSHSRIQVLLPCSLLKSMGLAIITQKNLVMHLSTYYLSWEANEIQVHFAHLVISLSSSSMLLIQKDEKQSMTLPVEQHDFLLRLLIISNQLEISAFQIRQRSEKIFPELISTLVWRRLPE